MFRRIAIVAAISVTAAVASVPSAAAAANITGNGTFVVGSQVAASTYRSTNSASTYCSWKRLKNLTGLSTGIIESGIGVGPQIVTIKSTDKAFDTRGCGTWVPLSQLATAPKSTIGTGTFSVLKQIVPTTYRSSNNASTYCAWSRLKNFEGSYLSSITSDIGTGPRIVTISSTDKGFTSSGCGTWLRLGALGTDRKSSFGAGVFSISKQIIPGTYTSSNAKSVYCSWKRLKNFDGSYLSYISSGIGLGPRVVTILASDLGFDSNGCGTWKRIS